MNRRLAIFLTAFAVFSAQADEPLNVTNTVDVSSGGAIAEPVALHRAIFDAWMENPDYNSWTNYTPEANVHYEYPQIVRLTCGTGGEEQFLTNLCPGVTYPYSLRKADGSVVSGTFTTAATPPRWLLAAFSPSATRPSYVGNLRDLGGWELPGGDGRRANVNVFFRSAAVDAFYSNSGAKDYRANNTLHSEFGINTELDLRGDINLTTVKGATDAIEDESYYFTTNEVRNVLPWGPENAFTTSPSVNDGSIRYFRVAMGVRAELGEYRAGEIRKAFHVLGTKAYHPVHFHCAGGRDRTGFVAMLIEALCGLSEEQIFRDHLAIVFAKQSSMYAERVDGNLRELYATHQDGRRLFTRYGDSLAGHARAYLEQIGVTADEIATVTQAYAGETPDEVLARVNAYEASKNMRTVWYVTRETACTNAVHRVGDGDFYHEPLLALDEHYDSYSLRRDGYRFLGWTDEERVDATNGVRYSRWEKIVRHTVTFADPFGSVLKSVTVTDGADARDQVPDAPPGTVITGWDTDVSDVRSDLTATCTMTGVSGYVGTAGVAVTDPEVLARGGDRVYALATPQGLEYVHVFTSTNGVKTFAHPTGDALAVSYLVVGGGGMSGDATGSDFGAGGGGGGGVSGATARLAAGETWRIRVGAGGVSPGHYKYARIAAEASSISNATSEVACAPGGGAGQSCSSTDTMTAGANGGGAYSRGAKSGATGLFRSSCDGVTYALNKGGDAVRLPVDASGTLKYALSGGGAGAGGDGGTGTVYSRTSGHGGLGVYSSITGELQVYGSGGGGGGGTATGYADGVIGGLGLEKGFLPGRGANGGGRGGCGLGASHEPCQSGADGFGGGAGGAAGGSSALAAGALHGGSGVVILRYVEPGQPSVWLYDEKAGTISYGGWTLAVTATGKALSVTAVVEAPAAGGDLDLTLDVWGADGGSYRVSQLGRSAFAGCSELKGMTLPEEMTALGAYAFDDCASLTNLVLSSTLREVGTCALRNCRRLKTIPGFLPPSVDSLGERAFYNCSNLVVDALYLPRVRKVPYQGFYNVPFRSVHLPAVTNVCASAFASGVLTNVVFGTKRVSFEALHSGYTFGYGTFVQAAANCSFHFPGKAPDLRPNGGLIGGLGFTGEALASGATSPMFGTRNGFRFYGSWRLDPAGWKKVFSDGVGSPLDEVSYAVPSDLEPNRGVKGVFRALRRTNETVYGWLIDYPSPAEGLSVRVR